MSTNIAWLVSLNQTEMKKKMKKIVFLTMFLGILAFASDDVSAQEYSIPRCNPNAGMVALWSEPNFSGYCFNFTEGAYPQISTEKNDRIYAALRDNTASSFKVGANVKAVICTEPNFMGHCEMIDRNGATMAGVGQIRDDQVSSVLVIKRSVPNDQIVQAIQQHRQAAQAQATQPQSSSPSGNACTKQVGSTRVNLDILNSTGKPFVVNWVDDKCNESASNQVTQPNQRFRGQTYSGHAFRVREAGTNRLLQEVVADPRRASIVVGNSPGNNTARQPSAPAPGPAKPTAAALPPATAAANFPIRAGSTVQPGKKYVSQSGLYALTFAKDGNLVVTTNDDKFRWGLADVFNNFYDSKRIDVSREGRLVAYDANNKPIWTSSGRADPQASLNISFYGALQLVTPKGDILWSSDGDLTKGLPIFTTQAPVKGCAPDPGWAKCVELNAPKIKINATAATTQSALNGVANVYTEMFKRFRVSKYPLSKMDGFKVYLTNGEPWPNLRGIEPVWSMWPDQTGPNSGAVLRGGAGTDRLWIEEQMVCKQGVDVLKPLGYNDKAIRSLDQVVHEMAHSIHRRYALDNVVRSFTTSGMSTTENWAARVQDWFGATPHQGDKIPDREMQHLNDLFTSRTKFSCDGYKR